MSTLADLIRENVALYANCSDPRCFHHALLDLDLLALRLGPDHGAMHADLVGLLVCSKCEAEGRPRRAPFFTHVPDYTGIQQRKNAEGWGLPKRRS